MIGPGDEFPADIELPDADGAPFRPADLRGDQALVLFFYPKDHTTGCTAEACAFRDQYEVFADAGAEVVGISSDSERSHQGFAAKYRLPFKLLTDKGGRLRKRLGIKPTMRVIPGRVTFVIDKQGIVQHVFESQTQAVKHIDEALAALKEIA